MGYSLFIQLNTFVETETVSIDGLTLPTLGKKLTITQTLLDLNGWEFAKEFVDELNCDYGDIEQEDVLRLYKRWCEIEDIEMKQEFVDIINNAKWGFNHGNQYFTYTQSY